MLVNVLLFSILVAGLGLWAWRIRDHWADRAAMQRIAAAQPAAPACFDPAAIADLPEPARRYFLYTIQPGTPLRTVADISMAGRFGMGTKANPYYLDMTARQTLAMPAGFVWKMRAKRGLVRVSGSDSERWSNANPKKVHRRQPFGGTLSTFRAFDGFRLPTHVEAGNFFGTDQYFPFFVADVTNIDFL